MSFDTPNGTRGGRQPGTNAFSRWFQHRMVIEAAGQKQAVTAEQLEGDERARDWKQITSAGPGFRTYETKTDREMPVIRLTPTAG